MQPAEEDGLLSVCLLNGNNRPSFALCARNRPVRESAIAIKDDIANQWKGAANKTLFTLAIISGIFLPLTFRDGLLGINIGGMPGFTNQSCVWIFCGAMIVLTGMELVIFKRLRWF